MIHGVNSYRFRNPDACGPRNVRWQSRSKGETSPPISRKRSRSTMRSESEHGSDVDSEAEPPHQKIKTQPASCRIASVLLSSALHLLQHPSGTTSSVSPQASDVPVAAAQSSNTTAAELDELLSASQQAQIASSLAELLNGQGESANNVDGLDVGALPSPTPPLLEPQVECAASGCSKVMRDNGAPLLICGRCLHFKYCSKRCQVAHIQQHKLVCKRH